MDKPLNQYGVSDGMNVDNEEKGNDKSDTLSEMEHFLNRVKNSQSMEMLPRLKVCREMAMCLKPAVQKNYTTKIRLNET